MGPSLDAFVTFRSATCCRVKWRMSFRGWNTCIVIEFSTRRLFSSEESVFFRSSLFQSIEFFGFEWIIIIIIKSRQSDFFFVLFFSFFSSPFQTFRNVSMDGIEVWKIETTLSDGGQTSIALGCFQNNLGTVYQSSETGTRIESSSRIESCTLTYMDRRVGRFHQFFPLVSCISINLSSYFLRSYFLATCYRGS